MQLIYRKALPETSVIETSRITDMTFEILYDLLITQDGTLLSGRSGDRLDVDAYKNAVFEPYDLKWIEQPKVKRAEALLSAYRLRPSYYV